MLPIDYQIWTITSNRQCQSSNIRQTSDLPQSWNPVFYSTTYITKHSYFPSPQAPSYSRMIFNGGSSFWMSIASRCTANLQPELLAPIRPSSLALTAVPSMELLCLVQMANATPSPHHVDSLFLISSLSTSLLTTSSSSYRPDNYVPMQTIHGASTQDKMKFCTSTSKRGAYIG